MLLLDFPREGKISAKRAWGASSVGEESAVQAQEQGQHPHKRPGGTINSPGAGETLETGQADRSVGQKTDGWLGWGDGQLERAPFAFAKNTGLALSIHLQSITVCKFSSRVSDILFWPPTTSNTHMQAKHLYVENQNKINLLKNPEEGAGETTQRLRAPAAHASSFTNLAAPNHL